MRTIISISLIVAGWVSFFAGLVTYLQVEADLFEKRPDLAGLLDEWDRLKRWKKVAEAYKTVFPQGRKLRNCLIFTIAGMTGFLSGFWVLAEFK
jgi:hypothetical protein